MNDAFFEWPRRAMIREELSSHQRPIRRRRGHALLTSGKRQDGNCQACEADKPRISCVNEAFDLFLHRREPSLGILLDW